MKNIVLICLMALVLWGCSDQPKVVEGPSEIQKEVQAFLDNYSATFQELYYTSSKAEWESNIKIVEGDTILREQLKAANQAYLDFTGSTKNIETTLKFLESKDQLEPLQVKQLDVILYMAASGPETAKEVVTALINEKAVQNDVLYGYDFIVKGKSVSTNDIDAILEESTNLDDRLEAWEVSKGVGAELKDGLEKLVDLKNKCVQALNYDDYFSYQVSDYGMTVEEMRTLSDGMISDVWPLYRELHTWARYTLAEKYGEEVPEMLPAHWLPNRWGQDWVAMVDVEGLDLDAVLKEKSGEWIVREGEKFYVSLGLPELPEVFYEKSSLYPLPDSVDYKKNNHASAWHLDLENDVRSLMSVIPNTNWWGTTLHELGHIYYFLIYTNDDVPVLLRGGANRGYHEALGSLLGLAALQKPFLAELNLIPADAETDDVQILLKEALNFIVFMPFSAGTMTQFEYELYSNGLPKDQYNAKWWELVKKYQGIVPPYERGEEFCDAASKTHIIDDAAQYY
ncbi:MAG: M2 family metallopeptidase, partial [Bacteroidetes bacterium]|nr:M2 family metallopeptidase [Bacteroidota bacterium]